MREVTQGTLIYGMRSAKYSGVMTYGIIISAACDLAQDKIEKAFYLSAIPLKEWLCSDEGFRLVTANPASSYKNNLLKGLESYDLSWEVIQTLTPDEFEVVAHKYICEKNIRNAVINNFKKYYRIAKDNLTVEEKAEVYRSENKAVSSYLGDIFNGSNTHFVFVPSSAITEQIADGNGLLIDLLELDYMPIELVQRIAKGEIDYEVLDEAEKTAYDEKFFIREDPGFAYPTGRIESPWREYVLQHFSNCFIRIGVDNPGKKEAQDIVKDLFPKEGE